MGQLSPTLGELLEIPNWTPFWTHNILEYDRLQELIVQKFYNREIAYDTPDYFRLRLNYVLEVNAPIYNRMLESEYVEINPFQTDYREETIENGYNEGEVYSDETGVNRASQSHSDNSGSSYFNDTTVGKSNTKNTDSRASTNFNANLFSSGENEVTDSAYVKDGTENSNEVGTKDYTLNKKWSENITYKDTTDHVIDITSERDIGRHIDSNQTARDWTEKGNSKAHNLDVNSDTPQSMLFNTPNHYIGTGTADELGIASGGDYTPYLEDDISRLDTESRTINGGDTPWFNYASNASNKLAHDNYNRSGTETYARNQQDNTDDDMTKNETGNKVLEHDGDRVGESNDSYKESTTDTISKATHEQGKDQRINSTAFDSNEHSSGTTKENAIGNRDSRDARTTNRNSENSGIKNGWAADSELGAKSYEKQRSTNMKNKKVISGHSMKSMSNLLNEYRNTLIYSADIYMLEQLEVCFMQIF